MFIDSVILKYILKMSVFPKFVYRFSVIPIQLPENYFLETDTLILKFYKEAKDKSSQYSTNVILKEKKKVRGLMLPNFKPYSNQDSIVLMKEETNGSME